MYCGHKMFVTCSPCPGPSSKLKVILCHVFAIERARERKTETETETESERDRARKRGKDIGGERCGKTRGEGGGENTRENCADLPSIHVTHCKGLAHVKPVVRRCLEVAGRARRAPPSFCLGVGANVLAGAARCLPEHTNPHKTTTAVILCRYGSLRS